MRHTLTVSLTLATLAFLSAVASAQSPSSQPASDTPAARAYEHFLSLAGTWEGSSTKGWTERLTIRPIAGGSCVMEQSEFAHGVDPANAMVTMYHLDGDRLMLTHYCMAKNQPRMRATTISPDAKQITFEFLDGTNLKSRDVGHMDKVVFNFDSPDNFRSQWTFYANGKEQWMEQITYKRVDSKVEAPPTTPPK
jgi:hypothetical protein